MVLTSAEFRLAVKHRLIDLDMSQAELIDEFRSRTGMFLDRSYLNKIYRGEKSSAKVINTICEILGIEES